MFTKFDKAFAALIVSGAVPILNHLFGLNIGPEVQATLVTLLAGLFVYIVPNKPA